MMADGERRRFRIPWHLAAAPACGRMRPWIRPCSTFELIGIDS
jgi:hypothetical protein